MSVYIITNRKIIKDDQGKELIDPQGTGGTQNEFRIATYHPDTKQYQLLPDWQDDDYHLVAADDIATPQAGTASMFSELYADMSSDQGGDVLFMIHGFEYSFQDNLHHIEKLLQLYVNNDKSPIKHLVYLAWPSQGKLTSYPKDQKNAWDTGLLLGRVFYKLRNFFEEMFDLKGKRPCGRKIHLCVHSLGNQVLKHMLDTIDDDIAAPLFSEVLLLNADVDWRVFEEGGAFRRLDALSERTHIIINRSDDALRISRYTKNFKKRLGFKGPSNIDSLPPETYILDTSCATGDTGVKFREKVIDHWGYLNRQSVVDDLIYVLQGMDEDDIPDRKPWPKHPNYFYLE